MKSKTTLILFALAVALALWIKFYESKRPNTEDAQRQAGKMLNFERNQLDGIVIQNGDDKIELRRSNQQWRLETPVKDQADASVVADLISDLEDWERDQTFPAKEIEADPNRLAEYDLVRPKLHLKLVGKSMPPEILFGKEAALENRMYVRFDNSKETFLVHNKVQKDIAKKPEDFRDRKLTDLTAAQVERVLLKTPAGEMEMQKRGENWEIVKPLRARGDDSKINDLIAQVTSARIAQFVADDHGDLQRYGLAEPRGSITLIKQGEKDGQMLQIGSAPEKEKDQVYVRSSARNFVYTLPKKIEQVLQTKPADLRDHHLVRIDTNNLDRLTIDVPGKSKIVLARKDKSWFIANKKDEPANASEVNRLLDLLKNEQVTRFVDDTASDLAKYGLDQPPLTLTFSSFASENTAESQAGEHPFASISFGRLEGEEVFARVGDEPFIVAVARSLPDQIFTDPVQWQDLSLFKFKNDDVHRLSVVTEKESVVIRGADKKWQRLTGDGAVNQMHVDSILNTLSNMRAVRWLPGPPPPQAFDKPQMAVTFTTSPDDKAMHKLLIGSSAGDGMWYGRVEGRDGTAVLSNPDFNALHMPILPSATPSPTPAATPAPAG